MILFLRAVCSILIIQEFGFKELMTSWIVGEKLISILQAIFLFLHSELKIRTWVEQSVGHFENSFLMIGQRVKSELILRHFFTFHNWCCGVQDILRHFVHCGVWCVCRLSTIQSLVLSCGKWSVSRNFRGWKLITCWAVRKNNNRPQVLALQNFKSLNFSLSLFEKDEESPKRELKKEPFHHVVVMAVD